MMSVVVCYLSLWHFLIILILLPNNRALGPSIAHLSPAYKKMYWPVAKEILFEEISIFSSGGHVIQLN